MSGSRAWGLTTPDCSRLAGLILRHASRGALMAYGRPEDRARWLADGEREAWGAIASPRRREDWLLGRCLAKQTILDVSRASPTHAQPTRPTDIHILSRDGLGRGGRPRVLLDGRLSDWSLSIAHSDRSVLVALARSSCGSVGVDLAPVEARSDGFAALWLTPAERAWARDAFEASRGEAGIVTALWAVKEAFYKATNCGEAFRPGCVEVRPDAGGGLTVSPTEGADRRPCRAQVLAVDGEVAAVVVAPQATEVGAREEEQCKRWT